MNLVDLFVLRRIAECGRDKMPALIEDCADVDCLDRRLIVMQSEGYLSIKRRRGVEHLTATESGLVRLAAEPTHYRESYGFTNR